MDFSSLKQQVVRAVRLFVITFLATFNLTSVAGGKAAIIAAVIAAAEVAFRAVFPVVPGLKALKKTPRETSI